MTPAEAVQKLDEMPKDGDKEILHDEADLILVELLKENGFTEVVEAYLRARTRVGFWYA